MARLLPPDVAIEIRAPKAVLEPGEEPKNVVHRFAPGKYVEAATRAYELSGKAPAVYIVMNGVDPALKLGRVTKGANAGDIPRRSSLLIDVDTERAAGKESNSTEAEKAAARAVALAIRDMLRSRGWPEPLLCDSGNGWHLIYRINLSNDDDANQLLLAVLQALAARFDNDAAKIDCRVFDAPRLVKLYGTLVMKGPATEDRPHRYAKIVESPPELAPVSDLQLAAVATLKPSAPKVDRPRPTTPLNLDDADLLKKIRESKHGDKFTALWNGDTSSYKHDDSKADFALLKRLAFWTQGDAARMERLFSDSALGKRDKWVERPDYRAMSIEAALKKTTTFYDPTRNGRRPSSKPQLGVVTPPLEEGEPVPEETDGILPTIAIGVDQHRVIDEAEAALAADSNIFCRTNALVRILSSEGGRKKHDPERPPGTPMIVPIEEATLSEILSKRASFISYKKGRDGEEFIKREIPPKWAVAGLKLRGIYPSIRALEGIIETPTIRRDGSILDVPGWDEETGLLFLPGAKFGKIPDRPNRDAARTAAALLLDLVCDVPFKDRRHAAAWLAALLTVIARHAVDGPTPLFVFDANLRSVGKSLLCDLLYGIAAAREMPRKTYPEDDAEMRKVITSIALAGDPVTMFDNLASGGIVGGRVLDNVLTGTTWKDRLLATNREPILSWRSVLFATGNNLQINADTFSRSCRSRIESEEIRPEERRDFKVKGCLIKHAIGRRVELVQAALTILRAHALAGRPGDSELPRIRSNYRSWSDVIRCAVYWATDVDPSEIQEDERGIDQDATTAETLALGWMRLCQAERASALSVSAALAAIERSGVEHAGLRELLMTWSRDSKLPSTKTVGRRLGQFAKRPTPVGTLDSTPPQSGIVTWFVRPSSSGFGANSGFSHNPSRENCADNCSTKQSDNDREQSHQSHQSHQKREIDL